MTTDPPSSYSTEPDEPESPEEHAGKLWDQLNNARAVALHVIERRGIRLPLVEHETSGEFIIRVLATLDAMLL
jgi:hypothetical protein